SIVSYTDGITDSGVRDDEIDACALAGECPVRHPVRPGCLHGTVAADNPGDATARHTGLIMAARMAHGGPRPSADQSRPESRPAASAAAFHVAQHRGAAPHRPGWQPLWMGPWRP